MAREQRRWHVHTAGLVAPLCELPSQLRCLPGGLFECFQPPTSVIPSVRGRVLQRGLIACAQLGLEGLHLGVISATSRRNLGLEGLHLGDC